MKPGFIALGTMGTPLARHLLAAGHEVFTHSSSGVPATWLAQGGKPCSAGAEVAHQGGIVFLMVPDTPHLESVLVAESGVAAGFSKCTVSA